jgi:pyroglutamyl-peptidase
MPMVQREPQAELRVKSAAAKRVAKPTVLLTGFDAFGGESVNPSWLAAQGLQGRQIAGHRVVAVQLPTVFGTSLQVLHAALLRHRPRLVMCMGQAGGRSPISLERVAININDARIADNAEAQPVDTPVIPGGPAAYFSSLPIKAMQRDVARAGIACEVSQTAGTFVCNHVFYGLMHFLATQRGFKTVRGGFVHVPFLPEQGSPSMPLGDITHGLKVALRSAIETARDASISAGALQ